MFVKDPRGRIYIGICFGMYLEFLKVVEHLFLTPAVVTGVNVRNSFFS